MILQIGIFQFDTAYFIGFLILLALSCLSLVLSLSFRLRARYIGKLPKNLSVSVFNKTFNVFDPYPPHRKIIHSFTFHIIMTVLIMYMYFFGFILLSRIVQMGLVLGLIIFVTCLSLMMIDEAIEMYKNANIFLKAVKNGSDWGRGDLAVLFRVKDALPKLSVYYSFLAIVFFASAVALPYVVPAFLMILARFAGGIIETSTIFGFLSIIVAALLYAPVVYAVYAVAKKIRSTIVGFTPSELAATFQLETEES